MNRLAFRIGTLASVVALTACNASGITKIPAVTQTSLPSIGKLQIAVGTVNTGTNGNATGLNVVTTFRQSNGESAVLLDTPTITGPAGFVNGASTTSAYPGACSADIENAGVDGGTANISGDPQTVSSSYVPSHTFGEAGLLGSYGIEPFNSVQSTTAAFYPGRANTEDCGKAGWPAYPQPFYLPDAVATSLNQVGNGAPSYIGGPPAYPFFNNGTQYGGFAGYPQGFDAFEVTPVTGTYTLSVNVPAQNAGGATFTASASLSNATPLQAVGAPTWTSDTTGGGSGTVAVPADPRITETMVYIQAQGGLFYTVGPLTGTGTLTYTLPDNLGPCNTSPSCTGATSLNPGTKVMVYAASYDYPAYEASPGNLSSMSQASSQTPTISGSGGQADISLSNVTSGTE
jgi:hypothetical protein